MKTMAFMGWGELKWLEPNDYMRDTDRSDKDPYNHAWKYLESTEGDDGNLYDIVYDKAHMGGEVRYTQISKHTLND